MASAKFSGSVADDRPAPRHAHRSCPVVPHPSSALPTWIVPTPRRLEPPGFWVVPTGPRFTASCPTGWLAPAASARGLVAPGSKTASPTGLVPGATPARTRLRTTKSEAPLSPPRTEGLPGQIGRAHAELQSLTNLVCRLLLEKKKQPP